MELSASVRLDRQLLAVERNHHVHCMLEVTAPPVARAGTRPPLHLALVIDRSGSMQGDKLRTATAGAAWLARHLSPTDQLSVVAFDAQAELIHPLQPVGADRAVLERALRGIQPGRATDLSGGWLKGVEQLRAVPGGNGPKKVLLLTDGMANQGVVDPSELAEMAHGAADDGVGTTTIGFGAGLREDLLRAMADAGAGNAHFAATPDEAPAIYNEECDGLAALVAQNLSVELRPTDEVKVLGVLNDAPAVSVPGGLQIQLGDTYAEETRRLVFELFVPELATLGVCTVAHAVVRYVGVGAGPGGIASHQQTLPISVNLVGADEAAGTAADAQVSEEVIVLRTST